MSPRAPWVAIAILVVGGGILLLLMGWGGTLGFPDCFFPFLLAGGAVFPFVAAFLLGREALRTPARRFPLAVLLAVSVAGALSLAWWGRGGTGHFLVTFLGGCVVGAMGVGAVVAGWAFRPGLPGREFLARSPRALWMGVLGSAVLCLSLPLGTVLLRRDAAAAKAWVEAAVAEVRIVETFTGGPPAKLMDILARLGPPPRLVPADGGYPVTGDGESFEFRIDDPSQFLPGWWVYEGKTGTWRVEDF